MVAFVVEGTAEAGHIADLVPDVAAGLAAGALVDRDAVEDEVDYCLAKLRDCWSMEPDQVMLTVSAISARMTEMCVHLHRLEGRREWRQIRTMQCDRVIAECDRQWKTASRLLEMRRQDIDMERGR